MALRLFFSGASFEVFRRRWLPCAHAHARCFLLVLSAALTGAVCATAQTPQRQYVYASVPITTTTSEVAGFSKEDGTDVLSGVGTPLADALEGGAMAVDAKGRFLFIVNPNSNGISMFQIDPATGALSEVLGSPFAAETNSGAAIAPSSPSWLTTENSGQFLYVGYGSGNSGMESAIPVYQIDAATPALVAPSAPAGRTDIFSPPVGMVTDPKGLYLYVGLGPNSALGTLLGSANVYPIDRNEYGQRSCADFLDHSRRSKLRGLQDDGQLYTPCQLCGPRKLCADANLHAVGCRYADSYDRDYGRRP